jgi:hypothetical protein
MHLKGLGWDAYFEPIWQEQKNAEGVPARVVSQQRGRWRLAGDFGECWSAPAGKIRTAAEAGGDWPAVGDWVAAEFPEETSG